MGSGNAGGARVADVTQVHTHSVLVQPLHGAQVEAGNGLAQRLVGVPSAAQRHSVSRVQRRVRALERGIEVRGSDASVGGEAATVGSQVQQDATGDDPRTEAVGRAVCHTGRGHGVLYRHAGVDEAVDRYVGDGVEVGQRGVVGVDDQCVRHRQGLCAVEVHGLQDAGRHRGRTADRTESGREGNRIDGAGQADVACVAYLRGRPRPRRRVYQVQGAQLVRVPHRLQLVGRSVSVISRSVPTRRRRGSSRRLRHWLDVMVDRWGSGYAAVGCRPAPDSPEPSGLRTRWGTRVR
ncbi:hypothetical protein GCM10020295_80170 [Streptomyces cinereospinus]